MIKKPEKPIIHYKTFVEFVSYQKSSNSWKFSNDALKLMWPCLECDGEGKIYDPNDPPVYGERRDIIKCPLCKGSKEGSESMWKAWYNKEKNRFKVEMEQYSRDMKFYNSIMVKLTKEELQYIERNKH